MDVFDVKYFVKTEFFGYARELKLHVESKLKPANQPSNKFVIFSTGRSGSTLLVNMLNTNPQVHCTGELLRSKNIDPHKVIKISEQLCSKEVFGFKLLTYQLLHLQDTITDKKKFLKELVNNDYRIIYLERKNSLLQALSVLYAMQRNVWHYKNEAKTKDTKITLPPDRLANMIHEFEQFKIKEQALLEGLPYMYLNYEVDLEQTANLKATVHKLEDYLNLSLQAPKLNLKKVTPKKLSSFLSNYQEISKFILSQKKYDQFTSPILDTMF